MVGSGDCNTFFIIISETALSSRKYPFWYIGLYI